MGETGTSQASLRIARACLGTIPIMIELIVLIVLTRIFLLLLISMIMLCGCLGACRMDTPGLPACDPQLPTLNCSSASTTLIQKVVQAFNLESKPSLPCGESKNSSRFLSGFNCNLQGLVLLVFVGRKQENIIAT